MTQGTDSLWWAVKRGDEAMVRDLLGRQTKELSFNLPKAQKAALDFDHFSLIEMLHPNLGDAFVTILEHKKKSSGTPTIFEHPIFQDMLQRLDFGNLGKDRQERFLNNSALIKHARPVLKQWLNVVDPLVYIEDLLNQLIDLDWGEEFVIAHAHQWSHMPDEDDISLYMKALSSDRLNIYSQMPQWHQLHHHLNLTCTSFQGYLILETIWDQLPQHVQDDILEYASRLGETSVLSWAMNNNILDGRQHITLFELAIANDRTAVVDLMFDAISMDKKQLILEQSLLRKNTMKYQDDDDEFDDDDEHTEAQPNSALVFFEDLMNIEARTVDDHIKSTQRQLRRAQEFKLFAMWFQQGDAQSISQWIEHIDETTRNTELTNAARSGHLELVQLLIKHGATDPNGTLLVHAAHNGHAHVVQYLARIETNPYFIAEAARVAIEQGHLPVFEVLEAYCDVTDHKYLFFGIAVAEGKTEIIQFLMDKGASFDLSEDWGRWIEIAIAMDNDTTIPQISHLIPYDDYQCHLFFDQALEHGLINSSQAMLQRFNNDVLSFPSIFDRITRNGCSDLRRLEMIINKCDHPTWHPRSLHMVSGDNHWAVLDLIFAHTQNKESFFDAVYGCIEQKNVNLLKRLVFNATSFDEANAFLFNAGLGDHPEIINALIDIYDFDAIQKAVRRLHVHKDTFKKWDSLYLVKIYQKMCDKRDLEKAVMEQGTEGRKRLM